jgi:serine/threonine-protein kinase
VSAGPSRWSEIEAALERILEADAGERDAVLERVAAEDQELRRELRALLAAHGAAGGAGEDFLETPAIAFAAPFLGLPDDAPAEEVVGTTIGRFTIEREIGRGGFGRVYLARRADGAFEQTVALKLLKRGMDSDEIVARFVRERQILARLEHPAIARLLDGGVTLDGRPYFVLEHVEGLPITAQCDRRRAGVEERLRLVVTVCRAVQHAHRNLVVHRDLKPSNVLVTAAGEVKLLDFGIAKLLAEEQGGATATVLGGARLLTPEYASPEQVAGAPVTTASDVYQLGVLLYELLTGVRPHADAARRAGGRAAALRAVVEVEPRRPSTVARQLGAEAAAARGATAERLARRLKGDLDAVVLCALAKAPEERYASAEELALELERHLADRPVRARGTGVADRARKFVRRHRLGVAAAALFAAFALGSSAFYTVRVTAERDRALAEADKALEAARLLRGIFRDWDPDASDREAASAAQLFAAAERQAERELAARPETLAATLSVLGDLETSIGETAAADRLLTRARELQERLPGGGGAGADLAATFARRGRLEIERGELLGAERAYRRARELDRAALGADHAETIAVEVELARTLWMLQRPAEAEAILRATVARGATGASALEAKVELGYTLFRQARYGEAAALLREALAACRATLGSPHALTARALHHLASSLRSPAELGEAEELAREAYRMNRELFGPERIETSHSALGLAVLYERKGDFDEAERLVRSAMEHDAGRPAQFQVALRLRTLGGIRMVEGDAVEAEALLRRALAMLLELFPDAPQADLGDVLNRLVEIADRRGAPDADALYEQAVAFERARGGGPYFVTDGYELLARAAAARGDRELAETLYRRAVALYRAELPEGHPYRTAAEAGLAELTAAR